MTKIPKKAQVAFNQFIFDTMMQKIRDVELLEKRITNLEGENENALKAHTTRGLRLVVLEKEIKDQRENYHAHIRQLVIENEEAHKTFERSIETFRIQLNNLISQNNGLTNEVLKLRDAQKKKTGRPKRNRNSS